MDISAKNIEPLVDGIIIIASEKSNWGESSPIPERWKDKVIIREPFFNHPLNCETDKRNFGLATAKKFNYTHFIQLDCDELYEAEPFLKAKARFENEPDLQGLVCRTQVYFKSPSLTVGFDHTLVPHIHRLTPFIKNEFNRRYPFAFEGPHIHIDPSRSLNINSGVKMDDLTCHHFSYLRTDLDKKIRNSTARGNIQKSKTLLDEYSSAYEGMYCEFYRTTLKKCNNIFNIPEFSNKQDHKALF